MQVAEIYFNNKNNKINKDLTDFLLRNCETAIIRGHLRFKLTIVKPSEIAALCDKGIKKLPAMTIANIHYMGTPDIVNEIVNRTKQSKNMLPPKSDDETLRDFQTKMLNIKFDHEGKHQADNSDNEDALGGDVQHKISAFNSRREQFAAADPKKTDNAPSKVVTRTEELKEGNSNRPDNVYHAPINHVGSDFNEVFRAHGKLKQQASSAEEHQDDLMLEALLNRMQSE